MSVSSMTIGGKIKFKIVLLGNQFVGKSSIIERFIKDRFEETYNATIGIDFLVRNIVHDNKTYRLQLWDTAGQERFRALIPSYLKDSHCALIVYDLSDLKTLQDSMRWLQFYNDHKQAHSIAILVGNKNDLLKTPKSCTQKLIQDVVDRVKLKSYQISAKTGQGIHQLFTGAIDLINQSIQSQNSLKVVQQKREQDNGGTASVVIPKQIRNIKLQKPEQQINKQVSQIKSPCC